MKTFISSSGVLKEIAQLAKKFRKKDVFFQSNKQHDSQIELSVGYA